MNEDEFEGAARNLGGKVKDAVGGLTGDAATQGQGKIDQVLGQAQGAYGQAVDTVKNYALEQPMAALLTAMGVGVLLGFMLGRR